MKTLTIRQVDELHSAFRRLIPRVACRSNVDRTYVNRIIKGGYSGFLVGKQAICKNPAKP